MTDGCRLAAPKGNFPATAAAPPRRSPSISLFQRRCRQQILDRQTLDAFCPPRRIRVHKQSRAAGDNPFSALPARYYLNFCPYSARTYDRSGPKRPIIVNSGGVHQRATASWTIDYGAKSAAARRRGPIERRVLSVCGRQLISIHLVSSLFGPRARRATCLLDARPVTPLVTGVSAGSRGRAASRYVNRSSNIGNLSDVQE